MSSKGGIKSIVSMHGCTMNKQLWFGMRCDKVPCNIANVIQINSFIYLLPNDITLIVYITTLLLEVKLDPVVKSKNLRTFSKSYNNSELFKHD